MDISLQSVWPLRNVRRAYHQYVSREAPLLPVALRQGQLPLGSHPLQHQPLQLTILPGERHGRLPQMPVAQFLNGPQLWPAEPKTR
eukprot:scaffold150966_cov22-Prasinocladus_malaysianus.AAC.1